MAGRSTAPPSPTLVTLTAILLGIYGYFIVAAWRSSSTDPQHGMADGFLMMVTLIVLGLAALLWRATARGQRRTVQSIFAICTLPSLSLAARAIYLIVRWLHRSE